MKNLPAPDNDDLISQMHLLVLEEEQLAHIGSVITDYSLDGRSVVRGPFDRSTCSTVLLSWFDRGWIDLMVFTDQSLWSDGEAADWEPRTVVTARGDYAVLDSVDARRLLSSPAHWLSETRDGGVMLCLSDEGELHPFSEWWDIAKI